MTSPMVEALMLLRDSSNSSYSSSDSVQPDDAALGELCMTDPAVGKPISHGQILATVKTLKASGHAGFGLEQMLRGSALYVPPPPPKPEPVRPIYLALLATMVMN